MGSGSLRSALALLSLSSLALCVSPVRATTVEDLSLRQMARVSTSIVHGTVVASSSRWNADRSMIVTDIEVQVSEALKGAPGGTIVVTQPGGTVGKLRVDVAGASAFRTGEDVVLFLGAGSDGTYRIAGLSRGRFDVVVDEKTGERRVLGLTDASAMTLSPQSDSDPGAVMPRVRTARGNPSLDDFLTDVRQLLREPGSQD